MSNHVDNVAKIGDACEGFLVVVQCPEMFGVGVIEPVLYVEPMGCVGKRNKAKEKSELAR